MEAAFGKKKANPISYKIHKIQEMSANLVNDENHFSNSNSQQALQSRVFLVVD